jgi:hypothetical protein
VLASVGILASYPYRGHDSSQHSKLTSNMQEQTQQHEWKHTHKERLASHKSSLRRLTT